MTKPFYFILGFILAAGIGMGIATMEGPRHFIGGGKSCTCPDMMEKKVEWSHCLVWSDNMIHADGSWVCDREIFGYSDGSVGWKKSEQSK